MMTTAGATRSNTLTKASLSWAAMLLAGDGGTTGSARGAGMTAGTFSSPLPEPVRSGIFPGSCAWQRPAQAAIDRKRTAKREGRRLVMATVRDTMGRPVTDGCDFRPATDNLTRVARLTTPSTPLVLGD